MSRHGGEIFSLNIDDLDIDELERRLEMSVAAAEASSVCVSNLDCNCGALSSCVTFCS